jgi:endonuclease-8
VPEGDTLVKTERRLAPALVGRPVEEVVVRRNRHPLPPPGTLVESVEARGKHLLIGFAGGTVLQSHLLMTGAWLLHGRGERWRDVPGAMRAVVATADHAAVLFRTPVARLWPAGLGGERPWERLGPDLCRPPVDLDEVLRRIDGVDPALPVGEVLLDQHVAAGIGNVYKSETLWACGVNPFTPVGDLDEATRRRLFGTASELLVANLDRPRRVTYRRGTAVYGRYGQGCPHCHSALRVAEQGPAGMRRTTTWCPRCQPA